MVDEIDESINVVAIDIGSGVIKAGLCGEEFPREVFPNVVGVPKCYGDDYVNKCRKIYQLKKKAIAEKKKFIPPEEEKIYIGAQASESKTKLTLSYPIDRGVIKDWDGMARIFEYIFLDLLEIDPEEVLVLLTEAPFTPKKARQDLVELMFETFQVLGLKIELQPLLSLYSTGRTTGLVVDSGDGITSCVPVFSGYAIPMGMMKLPLGGRDVTQYLQRLMMSSGYHFTSSSEHHIIGDIKESLAFISLNYDLDETKDDKEFEKTFTLPDGQQITVGRERYQCTEILFKPYVIGLESEGIAEFAMDSFKKCNPDVRSALYQNVVLAGGNTLFPNFPERLADEMNKMGSAFRTFKVNAIEMRQYSAWMGASALGQLSTFEKTVITIDDWEEYGYWVLEPDWKRE